MPKLLTIEEHQDALPILCVLGDQEFIVEEFVMLYTNKFRIVLISSEKPIFLEKFPDVYFISLESIELLPKLEETIDYALLFLSNQLTSVQIDPLVAKLRSDKTQTLCISTVFALEKNVEQIRFLKDIDQIRFGVIGEIISADSQFEGLLSKIIENAIAKDKISLENSGDVEVFPVTHDDAMLSISRLLFGKYKNDIFHLLFYKTPETILSASHQIARVEPDVKIIFSDKAKASQTVARSNLEKVIKENLSMKQEYFGAFQNTFEQGVEELLHNNSLVETKKNKTASSRKKNTSRKRKITSLFKFTFLSLFFGSFVFLFVNLLFVGLGVFFFNRTVADIKSDNFKNAVSDSNLANFFLLAVKPTVSFAIDTLSTLDTQGKLEQSYLVLEKGIELSKLAGQSIEDLLKKQTLSEHEITSSISNFSFLFQEGQRIALETKNQSLTDQLKDTYSKLLSFSDVIPYILGFDSQKNYLLLFQNSDELRPTGGFIGSIGDLTVSKGLADKLSVQDVYALDGQLKNHVEPPFVVRRYLQPHLYLRDSNFYPDYQETASKAAYIYNLETNKKPNAVIAINLWVLKKILKISGPILLTDYNVTVTSENVSQFLQNTIQTNFFPGSTQKKDVLNALLNQLVKKTTTDAKFTISLIKLVPELLEEKDILVSFSDNSIQNIFSANMYAGEFKDTRIQSPKNVNDFYYINEANIGVNKANAQVTREVSYEAMLGEGKLESISNVILTNKSTKDTYKAYVTMAVPQGSGIKQITIDGTKQLLTSAITDPRIYEGKNFKTPNGLEVEQYSKNNVTFFAFIVNVPPNQKSTIMVEYNNGAGKQLSSITTYSLLYIKQPGTSPYKLTTILDYPDSYAPVNTQADSYGKNFLKEEQFIIQDLKTQIELQKSSMQK